MVQKTKFFFKIKKKMEKFSMFDEMKEKTKKFGEKIKETAENAKIKIVNLSLKVITGK